MLTWHPRQGQVNTLEATHEHQDPDHRDLGIALSGGGHRATLFTLGALLYLVDSRANLRVSSIASVSGGSITNGYVAQECDFGTVEAAEFDSVARRLIDIIIHRGIISAKRGIGLVFVVVVVALGLTAIIAWSVSSRWVAIGLVAALVLIVQSRGWIIEQVLRRTLFHDSAGRPTTLSNLKNTTTHHILCATDLIGNAPIYFVGWKGGGYISSPLYGSGQGETVSVAAAVRSSAALPGLIRFRLFRSKSMDFEPAPGGEKKVPGWLFLSDGGVWNNLATQWFERDMIMDTGGFRVVTARTRKALTDAPPNADPLSLALLIVDGSGTTSSVSGIPLATPVVGEVAALLRTLHILYVNTIRPRVRCIDQNTLNYWRWGRHDRWDLDYDRKSAVAPLAWPTDWWTAGRLMGAPPITDEEFSLRKRTWTDYYQDIPDPPCKGFPDFPSKDGLPDFCSKVGTHLDRVSKGTAIALLMRGYLATMKAMHVTYGTALVPVTEERFLRLLRA